VVDDEVEAVADAEGGQAELEEFRVGGWGVGVINGRGTAGKNDAEGLEGLDFREGGCAREDYGEDVEFADAAGDELGILRPEVENNDCLGVHVLVWQEWGRSVKNAISVIEEWNQMNNPARDSTPSVWRRFRERAGR
jgi:hypothetical protein